MTNPFATRRLGRLGRASLLLVLGGFGGTALAQTPPVPDKPPPRIQPVVPPTPLAQPPRPGVPPLAQPPRPGLPPSQPPPAVAPPALQPPKANPPAPVVPLEPVEPPGAARLPPVPPKDGQNLDAQPGVIDRKGKQPLDPRFDPKTLGKVKDAKKPEELNNITVVKNFDSKFPCKKLPLDAQIQIDFQNMKLDDLTKLMSCITGKRFLLPQGVQGQITIMSPEPVTVYEAYKAYISSLEANGLTIVQRDKFYRIVAKTKARTTGAEILGPGARPGGSDHVITQLIPVKHILADEVKELLMNFATDGADITVYVPTNTLIVTEIASNMPRLRKLIGQIDKPTGQARIWVRPIEFAKAADVQKQVEGVFGKNGRGGGPGARPARPGAQPNRAPVPGQPGQPQPAIQANPATGGSLGDAGGELTMTSDERTNQLILITDRSTYLRVDKLIRKIDVPIPGEGQIHIHHLENAAAKDVQSTLQALTSGKQNTPGQPARPQPPAQPGRPATPGAPLGGAQILGGEVKITAHEPTNSLVIEASLKDYLVLKRVIRQLDVRRKQVYLESVIMEITSDKDRQFGLTGFGGTTFEVDGKTVPLLLGNSLGVDVQGVSDVMPGGLGALLVGPLLDASVGTGTGSASSGATLSIPAFGFAMKALQTNSDVNVLQTPHVLTTDNEEATIEVGRKVPFNSGVGGLGGLGGLGLLGGGGGLSGLGLGGAGGALGALGGLGTALGGLGGLGTVQFAEVKVSLKIKPTVNESSFVRLEIDQNIDDFDGFDGKTGAPNTSHRKVKNIVVVRDQQPVVIGGLMKDVQGETVRKIPILGDIPLLGAMFRQTKTTVQQKNLLMIIIPHIIDDPSDLKRVHEQRMEEIRGFADFLATRKKEYLGEIDYAKKHGMLEEINRVVSKAKAERLQLEQQTFDESELDPVGSPESHDLDYDPYKQEEEREGKGPAKKATKPRVEATDMGDAPEVKPVVTRPTDNAKDKDKKKKKKKPAPTAPATKAKDTAP